MVAFSYKARFVGPVLMGLYGELPPVAGLPIAAGTVIRPKRQTIRAEGKRRPPRAGETLQHYYAMRTKQCTKIGDGICESVEKIFIYINQDTIRLPSRQYHLTGRRLDRFAVRDGFDDWADMRKFWQAEHAVDAFHGVLICWKPLEEAKPLV